jgi:thermostable 8-oxoguanine DNA glycosylase
MHCIGALKVQQVIADISGSFEYLELPEAEVEVWPGLKWGRFDQPLTPAFWASQAWAYQPERAEDYRLGKSLTEEVIFCILGGHGAPAEVGLAASHRVCAALPKVEAPTISVSELDHLLRTPLLVNGKTIRYRFAAQRARYLAGTLQLLSEIIEDELQDENLREALCRLPGVGPKTASWIVRNRRGSDCVAILDVHIVRACCAMGVFPDNANPTRAYSKLEKLFLSFCQATNSRASAMDAVMWATMRNISHALLRKLIDPADRLTHDGGLSQTAHLKESNNSCLDQADRAATLSALAEAR